MKLRYTYDAMDLDTAWDNLTDMVEELYGKLDEFEEKMENIETGNDEDDSSVKFDSKLAYFKQLCEIVDDLKVRLTNIDLELEYDADLFTMRKVKTSKKTYKEFMNELLNKAKEGKK